MSKKRKERPSKRLKKTMERWTSKSKARQIRSKKRVVARKRRRV